MLNLKNQQVLVNVKMLNVKHQQVLVNVIFFISTSTCYCENMWLLMWICDVFQLHDE